MVACLEKTKENVEFHQIVDFLSTCLINYALIEEGDSVERAITTDASLVAAHDSDNIANTQSTTMSIDLISHEIGSGHTVGSEEDRMEQETDLTVVLALEEAKTTQDKVITILKLRVRRLEKKRKARTLQPMKRRLFKGRVGTSTDKILGEDASKQGRNYDQIEELNLTNGTDTEVIVEDKGSGEKGNSIVDQVSNARPEVSAATPTTPLTTTTIFVDKDLTIAQTLIKMRSEKAKEKNKLDTTQKERQKQEEATIAALTEEFDEIQAIMDAGHELAKETIDSRKSRGNKEQTTYKNLSQEHDDYLPQTYGEKKWIDDFVLMDSEKEEKKSVEPESKDKKGKRIKRVADSAPKQKSSRKQKMMQEQELAKSDEEESTNYEQENKELRMWLIVVSDEEETEDPEILSTKYPIVDCESQILGNVDMDDKHVYKIIRANGNTSYHKSLSIMLRKFDRQDLVDLHRLVMKRFEDNTPEGYNLLL
nr:hypothetical protein [Tanacetum cinerariifolium]